MRKRKQSVSQTTSIVNVVYGSRLRHELQWPIGCRSDTDLSFVEKSSDEDRLVKRRRNKRSNNKPPAEQRVVYRHRRRSALYLRLLCRPIFFLFLARYRLIDLAQRSSKLAYQSEHNATLSVWETVQKLFADRRFVKSRGETAIFLISLKDTVANSSDKLRQIGLDSGVVVLRRIPQQSVCFMKVEIILD